jgi:hypothetical protein
MDSQTTSVREVSPEGVEIISPKQNVTEALNDFQDEILAVIRSERAFRAMHFKVNPAQSALDLYPKVVERAAGIEYAESSVDATGLKRYRFTNLFAT